MILDTVRELLKNDDHAEEWGETIRAWCGGSGQKRLREITSYHDGDIFYKLSKLGYKLESVSGYGGEGKGDQYWGVFRISGNGENILFKVSGYYASFAGSTIDVFDWKVVTEKTKTVAYWE